MDPLEAAAIAELLQDAVDAALGYASGKTDPATAQAAFVAACARHSAARAAWARAEAENPAV